ncbi:MAG: hypothetical protein ACOYXW_02880 [Actinomycetota bacterium]
MAAKKATSSNRSVAGWSKGGTKKTTSKTTKKAATMTSRSAVAKTGRSVGTSAVGGRYTVARRAGTSKPPVRLTASGQDKTAPRSRSASSVRSSAESGLPHDLQEYLEAFVAELDTTVVPALLQRLRAGAARVPPRELAKRMLAVAPAAAPVNKMAEQVGPDFYDTAGVMVVLAPPGADPISKQAVEHRRRRRTVLALQTSDGRWIYPTWQFRDHEVMPGLAEVLAVFEEHSNWSVGTWLTTPNKDLDERTPVQWLNEGRDREHLLRLARHTAHRWAA